MNSDLVTLQLVTRNCFSVAESPSKWAVVRAATPQEADGIVGDPAVLKILPDCISTDLQSTTGVARVVTDLLSVSGSRMLRALAMSKLLCAGLVVAPYGTTQLLGTRNRFEVEELFPGHEKFVQSYKDLMQGVVGNHADRAIANIWLSTVEGRTSPPSIELLRNWVYANRTDSGKPKWISGLNDRTITGLRILAVACGIGHVLQKYAPKKELVSSLAENLEFAAWQQYFNAWVNEKHYGAVTGPQRAFGLLACYWAEHPDQLNPETFFLRSVTDAPIFDWATKGPGGLTPGLARDLRLLEAFLRWYAAKSPDVAVEDDWTGHLVLKPGYSWPLTPSDLDRIATAINSRERPAQSVQLALPLEFQVQLEHILLDNDMEWPKSRASDWIEWTNPETGKPEIIFCPVLPYILLLLMKLPIRPTQARRLDSGEGDADRYDPTSNEWVRNHGPHAGLWRARKVGNTQRGVLRRIEDTWNNVILCGLFINSNKTSDRKVLFSDQSGKEISWHNEEIINVIWQMRSWQERYNAVTRPLPFADVRAGVFEDSAETVKERRPDVFYLFRYPAGRNSVFSESPPTGAQVRFYWYELLGELERRLAVRMTNPPKLISHWGADGSAQSSPYSMYGLRVGGLTRLAMAGVHPWILQNIAGHAGFVMTLYYIKPSPAHISEHLNEKYRAAMARRQEEFVQFLSSRTIEEVHRIAVMSGDGGLAGLTAIRQVPSCGAMMARLDHGVCPNGRTRCHEGFRIRRHDSSAVTKQNRSDSFGKVPPTFGGASDCTQCRFFITGTPFIDGLRVKTNEVSYAAYKSARRQRELIAEIDQITTKLSPLASNGCSEDFDLERRAQSAQQELKAETDVLCCLAESLHAHGSKFQEVRALLRVQDEDEGTMVPALLYNDVPELRWGLTARFEALDELCHSAKWFPSIRAEDIKRERKEQVIQMLVREGKPPVIASLSEQETDAAVNALTAFLYQRLGRSAATGLMEGELKLEDLGIGQDLDGLIVAFRNGTAVSFSALGAEGVAQLPPEAQ